MGFFKKFPFLYAHCPLIQVEIIFDEKLKPSNGDQPHLYKMLSKFTFVELFKSIITMSAKKFSFILPLSLILKSMAGLWQAFSTIFSSLILPLL